MLMKRMPIEGKIDFMKFRWIALVLSALLFVASMVELPIRGLNLGVDFKGGLLVEINKPDGVNDQDIRDALADLDLGDLQVSSARGTGVDAQEIMVIRSEIPEVDGDVESAQQNQADLVRNRLAEEFDLVLVGVEGGPQSDFLRAESVGPRVSGELLRAGITALAIALAFMLAYIWFRFEWQFSVGAVAALTHDIFLTIGIFSLLKLEFNLTTIAALLTIIGYSMNDTVVVYDRIREVKRKYKKMPLIDKINLALNQTLSRTLLTSGTTLLALFSIYFLGGEVLRGFSFALIWGVFIGTYSSIFVASALLLFTGIDSAPPKEDTFPGASPNMP